MHVETEGTVLAIEGPVMYLTVKKYLYIGDRELQTLMSCLEIGVWVDLDDNTMDQIVLHEKVFHIREI